jgi:hypothetical protein
MKKLFNAMLRDHLKAIIISLVSTVIAVPLICACMFIPLAIASQSNDETTALLIMVIPACLFLLLTIGGSFGVLFFVLTRRAKQYDAIFAPLGLDGRAYMLSGRRYEGDVQGRHVDVKIYRGPALDMRIDTPLQAKMSVANSDTVSVSLARVFGREAMTLSDPGLAGMTVFAHDEVWTNSLLTKVEIQEALKTLLLNDSGYLMRQVHLEPGKLRLFLYRSRQMFKFSVSADEVGQWVDALLAMARIAESLPGPNFP